MRIIGKRYYTSQKVPRGRYEHWQFLIAVIIQDNDGYEKLFTSSIDVQTDTSSKYGYRAYAASFDDYHDGLSDTFENRGRDYLKSRIKKTFRKIMGGFESSIANEDEGVTHTLRELGFEYREVWYDDDKKDGALDLARAEMDRYYIKGEDYEISRRI